MKFKKLLCTLLLSTLVLTACGSESTEMGNENQSNTESENMVSEEASQENSEDAVVRASSAVKLWEQGNPTSIVLADIVEESSEDWKAWIKVSTAFDPTLSVYSSDLIPQNTQAVVVTFKISNMDCGMQNMYWCYQLITADGTVSLWNDTSAADKLTIDGDGTYQFVFDANKALGAPIDKVESLQIVLPGLTETTTTKVEFLGAKAITDANDVSLFTSGKVE